MQQQLQQIPWQTYGLTPTLIVPAINAIKGMEGKDKDLFSDDMSVKEIFRLGLRALKKKQAATGESSVTSDSSNKRPHSKPAGKPLQPRKKSHKMVSSVESEESDSVGSSKYVGKAP